jgi:hypothetical protein
MIILTDTSTCETKANCDMCIVDLYGKSTALMADSHKDEMMMSSKERCLDCAITLIKFLAGAR